MGSPPNIRLRNAISLAQDLLLSSKFSSSSNLNSLLLVDYQNKSVSGDFLKESQHHLTSMICDFYKQNAEANIIQKWNKASHQESFFPVKVSIGKGICSRCESAFIIRINQFRQKDLQPDLIQFRRDIAGKRFSDHPSVNHLNLLDYSSKAYDFIPSVMVKKFEISIFNLLFYLIQRDIKDFPVKLLPVILPKLISVLKLLNMESASTASLNFYFGIIDTILEKQHPLLILEIWKSLFVSDRLTVCAFERLTDHLPYRSNERLKWVLIMASYLQFDFYGAWVRGNKLRNYSNCPVTSALLSGCYNQIKILLDYGFLQNSRPLARYNVFLRHVIRLGINLCWPFEHTPISRDPLVREVLMFLIVRYIHKEDGLCSRLDQCFYLLWNVIPNPIVTKKQLMEEKYVLLLPYPDNEAVADMKEEMQNVINSYDEMAFGLQNVSKPRSLGHLCRCVVRKSLTITGNLPHGVRQLEIAKNLQHYLLLQDPEEFW